MIKRKTKRKLFAICSENFLSLCGVLDLEEELVSKKKKIDYGLLYLECNQNLKCSECTPLFLQAYNLRNASAVMHSHSINALMVTLLYDIEFQCIDLEMIKGIVGHKNTDLCRVPIIQNTEYENDLAELLKNAIIAYPISNRSFSKKITVFTFDSIYIHRK